MWENISPHDRPVCRVLKEVPPEKTLQGAAFKLLTPDNLSKMCKLYDTGKVKLLGGVAKATSPTTTTNASSHDPHLLHELAMAELRQALLDQTLVVRGKDKQDKEDG
jgi:hypothetical protein